MLTKLTESKIKGLMPPEAGQEEHGDTIVPGLRVRIGRSGKKTFILRLRVAGVSRNITLGRYEPLAFTLDDARRKARSLISDLEAGGDVLAEIRHAPCQVPIQWTPNAGMGRPYALAESPTPSDGLAPVGATNFYDPTAL